MGEVKGNLDYEVLLALFSNRYHEQRLVKQLQLLKANVNLMVIDKCIFFKAEPSTKAPPLKSGIKILIQIHQ